jgi:hypothetical protein
MLPIAVFGVYNIVIKEYDYHIVYGILLAVWIVGTIYASTKGIRFTLLLAPAFIIGFALFLGWLYGIIRDLVVSLLDLPKQIVSVILFLIIVAILFQPLNAAEVTAKNHIPSMNDAWYDSLTKIREQSEPGAIISSWWDFGHQFITIAQRGATADGGHQNTPQAHWLGKLLLTSDERESVGILRMLNCDANGAYEKIQEQTQDTVVSIDLLKQLHGVNEATARIILNNNNMEQVDDILESTHCDPPESFLITSEDMVGKAGVWAHFGSWDFHRARAWIAFKQQDFEPALDTIEHMLNVSRDEALNIYRDFSNMNEDEANRWISPWPSYMTGFANCRDANEYLQCGNVYFNTTTMQPIVRSQDRGAPLQHAVIYSNETDVLNFNVGEPDLGAIVWNGKGMAMHELLMQSIFTRLFFLEGEDIEFFERFSDTTTVFGQRIIVWQVDWETYLEVIE